MYVFTCMCYVEPYTNCVTAHIPLPHGSKNCCWHGKGEVDQRMARRWAPDDNLREAR